MTRSTLQPKIFRALQSGMTYTRQFNPVKKFNKFFCVSLAILLFISPAFAEETAFFPPESGTLVDSYRFPEIESFKQNQAPVIVHIQDAHNSLAVQKNIAALIDYLVRHYGFQAVYEEGNTGAVATSGVFWMPEKIRLKLAEQFLKEGKVTGAEFAHISASSAFNLYGAEDRILYERNLDLRQEVLFYKPVVAGYLAKLERELNKKAACVFSDELRHYLKKSNSFWKGSGKSPFAVKMSRGETARQLWSRLKERDRDEREALTSGAVQQQLLKRLELLAVLKKVASLEATRDDLDSYFKQQAEAKLLLGDSALVEESFRQVVQFYDLARQRDLALIRRTRDGMAEHGETRVILISGGFHSRGLTDILKKQGVAYAVVAPIASPETHTLREPNLFNLPHAEARLLADLRAMELAKERDPAIYPLLKHDAKRLWKRFQTAHHKSPSDLSVVHIPAGIASRKALILLPLDYVDSSSLSHVFSWMVSSIAAYNADFLILTRRQADTRLIRQSMNQQVLEKSVRRRMKTIRLLTPADFGTVANEIGGRYVLLVGGDFQKKRLEVGGISADQYLPLMAKGPVGSRSSLYREIQRLQLTSRAFVTSA